MNFLSKLPLGLLLAVILAITPLAVFAQEGLHAHSIKAFTQNDYYKSIFVGYEGDLPRIIQEETPGLLATLEGHTGAVNSVAFSPDGTLVASGGADGIVRVWDAATGELRLELEGHTDIVNSVAFSPDGVLLASAGLDGAIRLWSPLEDEAIATLIDEERVAAIHAIAFTPGGTMLAAADDQGAVRLWETATLTSFNILQTDDSALFDVTWSGDGTALAAGSLEGNMWLWDAPSNDLLGSHVGNAGEIYTIAYGPLSLSSALIAVGGSGDTMALWDLITGQQREPVQADADVRSLNFVAEGRVLVVDQDEVAAFWDVRFSRLVGTLGSYTSPVRDITLNPDQTVLASAYEDGVIKLWDMNAAAVPSDEPAPEGTADALAEAFTSEDGSITFSYPAGWSAAQETGSPLISLANGPDVLEAFSSGGTFQPGEVLVYIHTPEAVSGYLSAQQAAPAAESARLVANAYIQALSEPFSYPVDVTLGSLSGVRAQTVGGSYDGLIYVLDLGDGSYLAIVAASMTDNLAPFEATLDAVVASVSLAE